MVLKQTPLALDGINENIYAGFWLRLGSLFLDVLILIPYIIILLYINSLSKNAYYFMLIPSYIFHIWYNIYLVKKHGGTPGKLIVGIKVIKTDGSDVDWKEAFLRQVVTFGLTIFISIVTIIALSNADPEYFESLTWIRKQQYLMTLTPFLFTIYTWCSNIWTYGELFTLLFNKRKRAIHDYMANTVIVRSKYLDRIREVMNTETQAL